VEARDGQVARGTRGVVRAALAWPVAGWLVRSWLDEYEPCPSALLAPASASALPLEFIAGLPGTHQSRLRHSVAVAGVAGVLGLLPAAAAGVNAVPARANVLPAQDRTASGEAGDAPVSLGDPSGEASAAQPADGVHQAVAHADASRANSLAAAWPAPTTTVASIANAGLFGTRATLRAPLASDAKVPAPTQHLIQYRTQKGDALWLVAKKFGVSAMTVWWANDLSNKDFLARGHLLTLPASNGVIHVVTDGETLDSIARTFRADADAISAANSLQSGVVILGQRLFIPNGHGPHYQPLDGTDASPAQISLRPREQGRGLIPSAGPAHIPQPSTTAAAPTSGDTAKILVPTFAGLATVDTTGAPAATVDSAGTRVDTSAPAKPAIVPISIDWAKLQVSGQPEGTVPVGAMGGTVYVSVPVSVPATVAPARTPPAVATGALPPTSVGEVIHVVVDLGSLFTTQFDGSAFASGNCNMASAAMLYEVQTGINVTGAQMRAWSGATTRGTSLADLARAFATHGQPVTTRYGISFSEFLREVKSGRSAVVQGWYGTLPKAYDLEPGFTVGHSTFVLGYSQHVFNGKGGFYVMDPLGKAGYTGAWWPTSVMKTYGWSGNPSAQSTNRNTFFGDVALQATSTHKHLKGRPQFQNFWDTTKSAIEAALQVTVKGKSHAMPSMRGAVLVISDPRLTLDPRQVQADKSLAWPVPKSTLVKRFGPKHPTMDFAAKPGTHVVAAAQGRVVYVSYTDAAGQVAVWVEHGPNLYTAYTGLAHVQIKPGQWVSAGDTLGLVAGKGNRGKVIAFSVTAGGLPGIVAGQVDPVRFLGPR